MIALLGAAMRAAWHLPLTATASVCSMESLPSREKRPLAARRREDGSTFEQGGVDGVTRVAGLPRRVDRQWPTTHCCPAASFFLWSHSRAAGSTGYSPGCTRFAAPQPCSDYPDGEGSRVTGRAPEGTCGEGKETQAEAGPKVGASRRTAIIRWKTPAISLPLRKRRPIGSLSPDPGDPVRIHLEHCEPLPGPDTLRGIPDRDESRCRDRSRLGRDRPGESARRRDA